MLIAGGCAPVGMIDLTGISIVDMEGHVLTNNVNDFVVRSESTTLTIKPGILASIADIGKHN